MKTYLGIDIGGTAVNSEIARGRPGAAAGRNQRQL